MAVPLLRVEDLRVHLVTSSGTVKAVDGVSFEIHAGETLGLVGESGSGKTMTCLALIRLVPHAQRVIVSGQVHLDGEDLLQLSEAEMARRRGRKLSMILQDPMTSLNPVFSTGEQVAEPIRLHQGLRGAAIRKAVLAAFRALRIPEPEVKMDTFPHQLSGGMRQRVVGAAALSCEPLLLIADEPTTALDVTIQAQYLALLKELQLERQLGILFVTHDFGIVRRLCDRVAVMYAGKIVEQGATSDVLAHPKHPYTAGLLGSVPRLDEEVLRLRTIEGQPPDLRHLPAGCSFAPRCPLADPGCLTAPPLTVVGERHVARCWKWQDVHSLT